jgi:hypothetical protein
MTEQLAGGDQPLDVFLPLHEAARAYDVSVGVLRARARSGGLRAYKVAGPHGREWRVSLRSMASAGLVPRVPAQGSGDDDHRVMELQAELAGVRRRLVAEQRRADQADQELGHAMLELGRLRSRLARQVEPS